MPTNRYRGLPRERLLGEIESHIVGMQYHEADVGPGEQVNLERERENPHDAQAIRVENGQGEPVGHIARKLCAWLAPLLDSGNFRVDAHVPEHAAGSEDQEAPTSPLTLTIFAGEEGRQLLAKREVHTKLDALHEVVRRTYEEMQGYDNADLILELADGLRPLARQELLPETRLLLALMPDVARKAQTNKAAESVAVMQELLDTVTIGEPLHHHNVTVFPLLWPKRQEPPYVLLERAIEQGEAAVEEVDEDGDVPNLRVTNNGQRPVLIPEGEILVGAKQNRVVNVTVLVAAHSKFTVPVSCVEQGRWRYQSRQFHSKFCAPPSLRCKKLRAVHQSRAVRGTAESDQGEVWHEVAKGLADLKAHSPTSSLTDGFEAAKEGLQQYRQELPLPSGASGVLIARGDDVVGMDLFDCPETLQAVWERLSDAYFLDALRNRRRRRKATRKSAEQFLQAVARRAQPRVRALGLGDELEIGGDDVVGGALLYSGRVCHLAAFTEGS